MKFITVDKTRVRGGIVTKSISVVRDKHLNPEDDEVSQRLSINTTYVNIVLQISIFSVFRNIVTRHVWRRVC
jgi:hypothetical protein